MKKYLKDQEYYTIVKDILDNEDYQKLKTRIHHGDNRMDHCIRVSYLSYKLAKHSKMNRVSIARAALLHDFFLSNNQAMPHDLRRLILKEHPKYACAFAKKYFELSPLEEDIILSHMYPLAKRKPNYSESWLVLHIDNLVSIYDRCIASFISKIKKK